MMEKISVEEDEEEEGGLPACLPAAGFDDRPLDRNKISPARLICPVLPSVSTATKHQQHPGPKQVFWGFYMGLYIAKKKKRN
jgi:hypothetical protein